MSRHFHGQRHVKGGFTMDVNTIPPNARYWQNSAEDQFCRLQDLVGPVPARKMIIHIEGTWRAIYNSIKILADLAEKQITDASDPHNDPLYKSVEANLGKHVVRSCHVTDKYEPTEPAGYLP